MISQQQQLPPVIGSVPSSNHPSTSSTKSNSFDQHDSGIESGDHPPSTSSTSTSQRSSPSNDENKVVSSTANNFSKLTTTTNSSSVKCATTTTSAVDSKIKSKTDSLKISEMVRLIFYLLSIFVLLSFICFQIECYLDFNLKDFASFKFKSLQPFLYPFYGVLFFMQILILSSLCLFYSYSHKLTFLSYLVYALRILPLTLAIERLLEH